MTVSQDADLFSSVSAVRDLSDAADTSRGEDRGAQRSGPRPAGLVTSAKTVRVSTTALPDREAVSPFDGLLASSAWSPSFPDASDVQGAAYAFTEVAPWSGNEGSRPRIVVSPGAIRLEKVDLARRERTLERQQKAGRLQVDLEAAWYRTDGTFGPEDGDPSRQVEGWSRRSRSRMILRLAELDYAPLTAVDGLPAMLTLTYPGDWQTVAPDGQTVKKHLQTLFKRFARAWGREMACVWKMEFQDRGAPHFHLYMVPPRGKAGQLRRAEFDTKLAEWERDRSLGFESGPKPRFRRAAFDGLGFRQWISHTWADVVEHPDLEERAKHVAAGTGIDYAEGTRGSDPKRLAIYFSKHGTFAAKEYQHNVPREWQEPGKGPGRFWGYRVLQPVREAAEISWDDYMLLSRTLRRLSSRTRIWDPELNGGKGGHRWVKAMQRRAVERNRVDLTTGEIRGTRIRNTRTPVRRFVRTSGYLCVNDGPALARELARLRSTCLESAPALSLDERLAAKLVADALAAVNDC